MKFAGLSCIFLALVSPLLADPEPAQPEMKAVVAAPQKVSATIANMKQVCLALIEFDSEYGSFPDADTAKDVKAATGTPLTFEGGTSNDYFRQLIATGIKVERIFQMGGSKLADNVFGDTEKALAKGECDFAYVTGLSTGGNADTPAVLAPLVPGKLAFDPGPLGGKAVVLRLDGSVMSHPITPEGDVIIDGKSIFDPDQPFWKGKKPVVAWPK